MSKKNLWYGILYFVFGIMFLITSLSMDGKLSSIFAGFAGAGICGGIAVFLLIIQC